MSPRSILKSQPAQPAGHSPRAGHVHFPPSPQLSSTFYAHPSCYYDRSAIVVAPNDCALPSRNCPERTYVLSETRGEARLLIQVESPPAQYRAEEEEDGDTTPTATYGQRTDYFTLPFPPSSSRIPELTWSESEDSDGVTSPLTDTDSYSGALSIPARCNRKAALQPPPEFSQDALSFLPHAPTPPPPRQGKRSVSPRNRERKERTYASSSDSDAPLIPSSTSRRYVPTFTHSTTATYSCLDGF
ncbi:hypothetical protein BU17DRAFT_61543 [Hysterangium stoloniferum]|nr:hypothetical protein BU17DRAFT_61543 [Hysterangium stoloniferum]